MGKTSIRKRYFGEGFDKSYQVTLGADFALKRLDFNLIQIWDIAGNNVYRYVRKSYFKDAHGAIVVFDLSRPETIDKLRYWFDEIFINVGEMIPSIVVGNKIDLVDEEELVDMKNKLEEYLKTLRKKYRYKFEYIKSSALTGHNIDKIFEDLLEEIMDR